MFSHLHEKVNSDTIEWLHVDCAHRTFDLEASWLCEGTSFSATKCCLARHKTARGSALTGCPKDRLSSSIEDTRALVALGMLLFDVENVSASRVCSTARCSSCLLGF